MLTSGIGENGICKDNLNTKRTNGYELQSKIKSGAVRLYHFYEHTVFCSCKSKLVQSLGAAPQTFSEMRPYEACTRAAIISVVAPDTLSLNF